MFFKRTVGFALFKLILDKVKILHDLIKFIIIRKILELTTPESHKSEIFIEFEIKDYKTDCLKKNYL